MYNYCVIVAFCQHVLNEHAMLCYAIWIDIVDIGLLTINSYRVSSVNFVDIIVFSRSSGIDMRKIVCSFTSDTALNDVLVHALVCRIWKWKRISNVQTSLLLHTQTHTHTTHTHTHTHTTNVTIVRLVRRCASTSADDRCRRRTSAIHISLHSQQIREWVAFWTL